MADKKIPPAKGGGKSKGGGGGGDKKPQPACTVFVQGGCNGVGCNCPASGGGR